MSEKTTTASATAPAAAPARQPEVERLRKENAELRERLAERGEVSTSTHRVEPSYSMSEGERLEIEARGSAVSPFTGQLRTAADLPDGIQVEQSDKAREDGERAARREAARLAGDPVSVTTDPTPINK